MNASNHISSQLAKKYRVPHAAIERLILEETDAMLRQARVTTFVPILAQRRVEERLRRARVAEETEQRHAA